MPVRISVAPTIAVPTAPPILLMNGCSAKVTAPLRCPSFHWPYSMQSVRNTIISTITKDAPTNNSSPAMPMGTMSIGEKKNTR